MKPPKIESYCFGEIVISGEYHRVDILIFPDRIRGQWWRKEGHRLAPEDLEEVLLAPPEVLVIGQGSSGCISVPAETLKRLQDVGIKVVAQRTYEACDTYNRLSEKQKVVASLHLTC
ncbi:MAG: Mth938-like domain-containing protein [Candidatus Binatia bacterium]